ncbi:MAG: ATP-binding protein [Bacteroidales bacterium]|nr:ATP-binding protein [Bacteroidales bacterium]
MLVEELAKIIADQREEIMSEDMSSFCERLEASQLSPNSSLAQVVIGVRRSGKSTLCTKFLLDNAVECAFVNFDDERLAALRTEDLNKLLEAIYIVYGDINAMFFDEIQNVEAWPLFVNRLLRQKKRIFLTGSNSKLLSNELITHLTGRYNKVELYPFSFADYCQVNEVDTTSITTKAEGLRQNALHKYLTIGGFPELQKEGNPKNYIDGLFNAIIRNDIARRFNIRQVETLGKMAAYLADNFAQEFSATTVGRLFGISNHTAEKYFGYLKEAFLFVGVRKFSYKAGERIRNEKCYVVDVAMASERNNTFSLENLGWRLENVVCVELLRRYHHQYAEIFYYKENSFEIDFLVAKNGIALELIQVSYNITSDKTRQREINALLRGAKKFNCRKLTLITFSTEQTIEKDNETIHVIPATKWLTSMSN